MVCQFDKPLPISWRIFQFVVIHTVKGFTVVNEAEADVFLEFPYFFYNPRDVGNLISGSSAFSKSSLYIWMFLVHVLSKPSFKDFQHYLASMWNEFKWVVVWTFFGITLFGDWNENWPFRSCGHSLSFPNVLTYWGQTLTTSCFKSWNSSTGIPSAPLAMFLRPTCSHTQGCVALGE